MMKIKYSKTFEKDYKRIKKRGYKIKKLQDVVLLLKNQQKLPRKYKDHELSGNYSGYRKCHIEPDWLLIYKIENDILTLVLSRTGTHSDLF